MMRKTRDQIYDELLVLKCRQGDREAFEELVGRWQQRLWVYAYQVTRSEAVAWDIVQETWIGIIKGIRRLQDVAAFRQWAFRILNNKCTDWLRRSHVESKLREGLAKQAKDATDKGHGHDDRTESLHAAIEKLQSDQQVLLTLRYREDFQVSDIADILGIREGTVKSRIHRTLEKLRYLMGPNRNG